MNFDIRKNGQLFGPHTWEELKALVDRGEVSESDIVIKEDGDEVAVGAFLQQSRPLKLKVLPHAVPEPRLTPPPPAARPPRPSARPSASMEPPLLPAAQRSPAPSRPARAQADAGEPKPVGNLVWITPLAGVVCAWLNYRKFIVTEQHNDFYFFESLGQMIFCVILCVGIRASRPNLRTPRATWMSVLLGFVLSGGLAASKLLR